MAQPPAAANPHEAAARRVKAYQLEAVAREQMTVAQAEAATPHQRHLVAQIAGVRDPSDATWAIVCDLLARRTALRGAA